MHLLSTSIMHQALYPITNNFLLSFGLATRGTKGSPSSHEEFSWEVTIRYFVKCGLETSCAQKHQYRESRQWLASTMLFFLALLLILYLHNNKQCIIVAPRFNLLICKMAMKHLFLCTNGNSLVPCCSGQWKQEAVEIYVIIFSVWKLPSKKHISDI